ncbi:MAG: Zn-ribbon domain-containing OB-fold protein [Candidatus Altiarchaeota archaeon]
MTQGLPLHWRLISQRYNIVGSECTTCGQHFFPKRKLCPECRRKGEIVDYRFSGKGVVYSHTTIYAPPTGYDIQKPYVLAIVKLNEGPRITAQVVDCNPDDIRIGTRVEAILRRIKSQPEEGIIRYAYKFRPLR